MNDAGIQKQDLQTLVQVGQALWMDPRESQVATLETLSAVTLLDLTPERALERAAAALLDRVTRRGDAANFRSNLEAGLQLGQPFFRLLPEDRFLLVALHQGRWSYARLSRIFGEPVEKVEAHAWNARIRFAASETGIKYPSGAPSRGQNCPEYDAQRPWTQRFLDEEIASGRERVFLQNHLMACGSCRDALARCRETYYAIEKRLPRAGDEQALADSLGQIARQAPGVRTALDRTFVETLGVFVRRRDVQVALGFLGILGALLVRKWFK